MHARRGVVLQLVFKLVRFRGRTTVHFIIRATIPNSAGNKLVKGDMQATFDKIMADVKPEHVFFSVDRGQRTVYMVVNLQNSADMVRVAEPLWLALEAEVECIPTMTAEEFGAAGASIAQVVSKY